MRSEALAFLTLDADSRKLIPQRMEEVEVACCVEPSINKAKAKANDCHLG